MRVYRKKQTLGRAHDRRKWSRRGVAMIEAAAVMPVFVAILLGLLEFSTAIIETHKMNAGTRSGARLAVLAGTEAGDVEKRVTDIVGHQGILNVTVSGGAQPGDVVTVETELPYAAISLVTPDYLTGDFTLRASTTMRHE